MCILKTFKAGGMGRNLVAMLVWQGANYLAPLLTFPHLTRVLHPAGFGLLGLYLLIGGWLTIASDWGTNMSGAREIAQEKASGGDISQVFWSIFSLRIIIAAALLIGVAAIASFPTISRLDKLLLFSAWTMALGNALTVSWCMQGLERLDAFAGAAIMGRLFTVPATILLVHRADEVWVAVAIQGGGSIVIALASIFLLWRTGQIGKWSWSAAAVLAQAKRGFPILVSVASHGVNSSTAAVMLNGFQGAAATGVFLCADRLRQAVQGLVQPINQAVFPRISKLAVTDRISSVHLIYKVAALQLFGMSIICSAIIYFAKPIIFAVSGKAFVDSVFVLQVLMMGVILFVYNNVLGTQSLLSYGYSKVFGAVNAASCAVNVIAMALLTISGSFRGAALASVATELAMAIGYTIVIVRKNVLTLRRQ